MVPNNVEVLLGLLEKSLPRLEAAGTAEEKHSAAETIRIYLVQLGDLLEAHKLNSPPDRWREFNTVIQTLRFKAFFYEVYQRSLNRDPASAAAPTVNPSELVQTLNRFFA